MIRILQTDGKIIELPGAVTAEVQGKEVVCYDRRGVVIARYPSDSVTLFGTHLPDQDAIAESEDAEAGG